MPWRCGETDVRLAVWVPAAAWLASAAWLAGVALAWPVVGWPEPLPATWVRLVDASLCIWISAACMAAASCWSRVAAVVTAGADAAEEEDADEEGDVQAAEPTHAGDAFAPKLVTEAVLADVAALALLPGGHVKDNEVRLRDMGCFLVACNRRSKSHAG